MMTRIAALKAAGASAKSGAQITLLAGLLWMAATMVLGGGGIIVSGFPSLGGTILLAGLLLGAVTVYFISMLGATRSLIARLIAIRLIAVSIDGIRTAVALEAIGIDVPVHQAMVFTLASSFGSALSLVPAGLGMREFISGALAPIVGIPIALGFAAAVIIRLADLAVVFVLTIALGIQEKYMRGGS
jgi:uncharacterized membrane protein YbhN (UPF0104 family)